MWTQCEISRACLPTSQRDPGSAPDRSFTYIDIASVDKERKQITQTQSLHGAAAPSRARKVVRAGDVLVSTVRPNLNSVAIVPEEYNDQIASTGFCVLRPTPGIIEGKYLFYFTQTPRFIQGLISRMRGANYPAVSDQVIKATLVPLPTPSEQRRIVEILDQADSLRKNRAEADTKAQRILPALFRKLFGDPGTNEMDWPKMTLSQAKASVRYGLGQPPANCETGLPLLRATNIHAGTISEKGLIRVDASDVPATRDAFLRADEVLVVRSGAYTGDVAQVTEKWAGAVAGYDLVVSPGEQLVGEFLEAFFLTYFIQKHYFGNIKARAGQPHLNADQLLATPIFVPPKDLQLSFKAAVIQIRQLSDTVMKSADSIERLHKSLTYRAFSGDLTAQWREAHLKELLQEMETQARWLSARETDHD